MTSKYNVSSNGREYKYYRCPNTIVDLCPASALSERKLEEYLLKNIRTETERQLAEFEVAQAAPKQQKKKADVSKLQERLRRVNVSYQAGNMTDNEYLDTAAEIKAAIAEAQKADADGGQKVNIQAMRDFLDSGFDTIYGTLTQEERRALWCSIINHIVLLDQTVTSITFRA